MGEFGSLVLIAGKVQIASHRDLRRHRERRDRRRRPALSVVLLVIALLVLFVPAADGGAAVLVSRRPKLSLRAVALLYLALLLLAPVGVVFIRTFEHGFGTAWG